MRAGRGGRHLPRSVTDAEAMVVVDNIECSPLPGLHRIKPKYSPERLFYRLDDPDIQTGPRTPSHTGVPPERNDDPKWC